jgi:hypothetical protein
MKYCFCVLLAVFGCSDSGTSKSSNDTSGGGGSGASATGNGGGSSAAGGSSGAGGDTTAGGGAGTGGVTMDPVDLPAGSRELDGVVNLVDSAAAAQLEQFLSGDLEQFAVLRQGLTLPFNLFVDHYLEEYDFVFFITAGELPSAIVSGRFEPVNRPAAPGGTDEIEIALAGYQTDGRTKGVIGIPYVPNYYPPFSHEVGHFWAVYLDPSFGFGEAVDQHYGVHWGLSSVNGQLGGFDGSTLRCETPAGALPPACTPLDTGRTRYVVGAFGAVANGFRSQPYAPLELYLMGLLPASDVPESFQSFTEGQLFEDSFDEAANTVVVEASGIRTLPFSDIVARHGNVPALPEVERHFRAAFVVVSAEPASDAVMADVANWAAVLGNRRTMPDWYSFEADTAGLATLDTLLGRRRDKADPAPPPRQRFECDVLTQDCGRPELGCHYYPPAFCALTAGVELGQPCDAAFECAPGLDCVANASDQAFVCMPYCDPNDASSPLACATICGGDRLTISYQSGAIVAAVCLP